MQGAGPRREVNAMKSDNGKSPAKFRVGERVQFGAGGRQVWGTVVEDRGPIGVNGRRLYRISVPRDPQEPEDQVKAEEELKPDSISRVAIARSEIMEFLKGGALLEILLSSSADRPDRRVWLCRGPRGDVAYTFSANRGQIGGLIIPESTIRLGLWIEERRKNEVAAFLLGFGLSPDEAMDVIRDVGVSQSRRDRER
jgi:hypothetical protein